MPTVAEVQAVVQSYLTNNIDVVELRGDQLLVRHGTTACSIVCHDWGEGNVIVKLMAMVLSDVPLSDGLYARIGRESGAALFGSLMLVEDPDGQKGDLFFHHTLLGDTLDEDELMFALTAIIQNADELDDAFQADFGGERVADLQEG